MLNVTVLTETDGKLLVEIDTTLDHGISKSGKSQIIASTQGNADVKMPDGRVIKLGINCYIPVKA